MGRIQRAGDRQRVVTAGTVLAVTLPLSACMPDALTGRGSSTATVERNDTVSPMSSGAYTRHSTTVNDIERTWGVYTPDRGDTDRTSMPVVLVVHGTGDTGDGIRSGIGEDLEREADEHGFVIAYIDGHENNWNECRAEGEWAAKEKDLDDVGLMRHVVDRIHHDLGADTVDVSRTFAVGFSSGGHMVQRLAYEAPDLVTGIASVNANVPADDNNACTDSGEPVPAIFIQGREDPMNPFDGGEVVVGSGFFAESRGEVRSAHDSAEWFAQRNGLAAEASSSPIRDGDAEITTWDGEFRVRLVALDHSGHSFPTTTGRWGNTGGARYDGPGAIWEFFAER
ncbi:PHB depolymerase family esterase [Corynebacterium sp.]|uniref:alpha/beta hydrolase family esterase n=1 Tax=Corynebacterium sp. TaxID=1720 RepID=UPI0028A83007|nr:PHB depolymerase family esterase [Corynebacterium sp.]